MRSGIGSERSFFGRSDGDLRHKFGLARSIAYSVLWLVDWTFFQKKCLIKSGNGIGKNTVRVRSAIPTRTITARIGKGVENDVSGSTSGCVHHI